MSKQFKQFILTAGTANWSLREQVGSAVEIYQIGIQAPYGTSFKLNDSDAIIGPMEIFEISNDIITLKDLIITSFDSSGRIIIDVMYA